MTDLQVALRADADSSIGVGHVMRLITLGRALVELDATVVLASATIPHQLASRAEAAGLRIESVPVQSPVEHLRELADVVVIDGYHLATLSGELTAAGQRVVLVDDNRELPITGAALVINQNLHASPMLYGDADPGQRLLLGPQYAMIRKDVTDLIPRSHVATDATKVLVALGGADPRHLTGEVVEQLLIEPSFEVWVAVGAANPQRSHLLALVDRHSERVHVARSDLLDAYEVVDLAVIAAGTTLWEVGYLGIPTVAIVVAENQVASAATVVACGLADVVDARDGDSLNVVTPTRELAANVDRRQTMSCSGQSLFDGEGARRVAMAIRSLVDQ